MHWGSAFTAACVSGGFCMLMVVVLVSIPIRRIDGYQEVGEIMPWVAAGGALMGLSAIPRGLLMRAFDFRQLAIRSAIATTVAGALGIVLALRGAGVWALVVQQLTASALVFGLSLMMARWVPQLDVAYRKAAGLLQFGVNIMGAQLASVGGRNADNVIIGAVLGPAALGVYSLAYRLYEAASELVVGSAGAGLLHVQLVSLGSNVEQAAERYYEILSDTTAFALPLFLITAAISPTVVPLVLGQEWRVAGTVATWLFLAACATTFSRFSTPMLLAAGQANLSFRISMLNVALNVTAFAIGAYFGVVAVAAAFFIKTSRDVSDRFPLRPAPYSSSFEGIVLSSSGTAHSGGGTRDGACRPAGACGTRNLYGRHKRDLRYAPLRCRLDVYGPHTVNQGPDPLAAQGACFTVTASSKGAQGRRQWQMN
ncbi:MAG: oligosaccharide flippase family protein [Gammaproteobacteria bacterium]|nr:oligosaccharide flippase family protein [Gammaproteobacteria bacterium]